MSVSPLDCEFLKSRYGVICFGIPRNCNEQMNKLIKEHKTWGIPNDYIDKTNNNNNNNKKLERKDKETKIGDTVVRV